MSCYQQLSWGPPEKSTSAMIIWTLFITSEHISAIDYFSARWSNQQSKWSEQYSGDEWLTCWNNTQRSSSDYNAHVGRVSSFLRENKIILLNLHRAATKKWTFKPLRQFCANSVNETSCCAGMANASKMHFCSPESPDRSEQTLYPEWEPHEFEWKFST